MLRHLGYVAQADRVETAVREIVGDGRTTHDLGGSLGTAAFADAVIERLSSGVSAAR